MESLTKNGLADFIDKNALIWLARILGWPHEDLLFMYPQYRNHEFKQQSIVNNLSRWPISKSLQLSDEDYIN
jgi:hypothetical protein